MSGLSSVGSALASSTSGASNPSSSPSLLSQVGQSLLTTGQAPNPALSGSTASTSPASTLSSYQAEFLTLQQQDTAELLYASFLSPSAGLQNADDVLGQAAQLLGIPGTTSAAGSVGSSTGTSTSLPAVPSVASILSASDAAAQQTLAAYGNAPAGSSIIDYQA